MEQTQPAPQLHKNAPTRIKNRVDEVIHKVEMDYGPREDEYSEADAGYTLVAVRVAKKPKGCIKKFTEEFWQRDDLWLFCLKCLEYRVRKYEIKRLLNRFIYSLGYDPKVPMHQFNRLMARARVELRFGLDSATKEDHIAEAYELMRQIITNEETAPADRIKAQQVINDMLGLSAKYTQEDTSPQGQVDRIRLILEDENPDGHDSDNAA